MPKSAFDKLNEANIAKVLDRIDKLYSKAAAEAAAAAVSVPDVDTSVPLDFDDYPALKLQMERLTKKLSQELQGAVVSGVNASWAVANKKNDALALQVLGLKAEDLTEELSRRYFSNNDGARKAFLERKAGGLNLSERVWRYMDGFKEEIEMGLDLGIRDGKDAPAMARSLKQYLRYPDKLFRRVRDEHGMLHLSQHAAAFHPGQGVYRSSYMNAKRLAATETNTAYHTSDYERLQQLDFIVGIEVHLSGNHTCLGRDGKPHAFYDICDELKGKYPKTFRFTGWHPWCRCYTTTILKTDKELAADEKRIMEGKQPTNTSKNAVTELPDNFKGWLEDNAQRIEAAQQRGTLPYFIRGNMTAGYDFSEGSPIAAFNFAPAPSRQETILEQARFRHEQRTQAEAEDIRARWAESRKEARIAEAARIRHEQRDTAEVINTWRNYRMQQRIDRYTLDKWIEGAKTHPLYDANAAYASKIEDARVLLFNQATGQKTIEKLSAQMEKVKADLDAKLINDIEQHRAFFLQHARSKRLYDAWVEATKAMDAGDSQAMYKALKEIEATEDYINKYAGYRAKSKQKKQETKEAGTKEKKKSLRDANGIEEIREMLGDETPALLENYEESVKRRQWLDPSYKKLDEDKFTEKMREFFSGCSFGHFFSPYAAEGYLEKGILTTHHRGRNVERENYAKKAYKLTELPHANEMYRCGVPFPKGDYRAAFDAQFGSGYGDAMAVIRPESCVTTFTYRNSLNTDCIPSLTCKPRLCSIDSIGWDNIDAESFNFGNLKNGGYNASRGCCDRGYLEVQFLPRKNRGGILARDIEALVMKGEPTDYASLEIWQKWADQGTDIYCIDRKGKLKLFLAGNVEKIKAEVEAALPDLIKNAAEIECKDIDLSVLQGLVKKGDYRAAFDEYKRISEVRALQASMTDVIPDIDKWKKRFTTQELADARDHILETVAKLEAKSRGAGGWSTETWIERWGFELKAVSKGNYDTWEIAYNYYASKANPLILQEHGASIQQAIAKLTAYKTKDTEFKAILSKIGNYSDKGDWWRVENLIKEGEERMLKLKTLDVTRELQLGECRAVLFSGEDFTAARRQAAIIFRENGEALDAFKRADDYMSSYAQEMWKKLKPEEREILWLYTDGSRYINEEMLGTYSYKMISAITGTLHNGLTDANVLTTIIEKAPALKADMIMQSAKSTEAVNNIFGINFAAIARNGDLKGLIGREGASDLFTSCSAAFDGEFVAGDTNTGRRNDFVFNIFMPKGTKGIYLEPIASFGDAKRGKAGYNWTGTKRKCAPSRQVEFLLQRGAKFRIADVKKVGDKWYLDVDLIEQQGKEALNDEIYGLEWRSARPRH